MLNLNVRPTFCKNQQQNSEKKGEPKGYGTIKKNVSVAREIEEQMKLMENLWPPAN